jgi:hypothetical protein
MCTRDGDIPQQGSIEAAVGIFWAIQLPAKPAIILDHRCLLRDAEAYGDMLTSPHGHYDVWEHWRKHSRDIPYGAAATVKMYEYEEWPRGRIVYDPIHMNFTCYADLKILRRADLLNEILKTFGLIDQPAGWNADNHYRSTMQVGG